MGLFRLMLKETLRRPLGFVLSILAVTAAAATFISVQTMSISADDALRKLTLTLGQNVLIVPKGSPHDRLWAVGFGEQTMEDNLIERIATTDVEALRFAAQLERRVEVDGAVAVLTGVRFELGEFGKRTGKGLTPPGFDAYKKKKPNEAIIGAEIAGALRVKKGDSITVLGRGFRVLDVRAAEGTIDDIRIYIDLKVAQEMLNQPGRINNLLALGCTCPVERANQYMGFMTYIQRAIQEVLPETDVIMLRNRFEARQESRLMMQTAGLAIAAALFVLTGAAVAIYMFSAVTKRRYEIALLIALGHRPWKVLAGPLVKVLVIGLLGAGAGLLLGQFVATRFGPYIATIRTIAPQWGLWRQAFLFGLALSFIPAVVSLRRAAIIDPADQLRNQ